MKTAKIGAIFLIAVMALAGVGAGYAAWFDTITIEGTVNTGSVGWDVIDYSGTWVWKDFEDQDETNGLECVVTTTEDYPDGDILVAYSYAEQTTDNAGDTIDDSVTVVFDNLFPCIEFEADFTVEYTGSVPGKINSIEFADEWGDTNAEQLIDQHTTLTVTVKKAGSDGWQPLPVENLDGYQLHLGDQIHVVMMIHLPQFVNGEPTDYLMDLSGSFEVDIDVIQWNEYGETLP